MYHVHNVVGIGNTHCLLNRRSCLESRFNLCNFPHDSLLRQAIATRIVTRHYVFIRCLIRELEVCVKTEQSKHKETCHYTHETDHKVNIERFFGAPTR